MQKLRRSISMVSVGVLAIATGIVSGQNYPNKVVRIVTPGPGGGADFVTRLIAQGISGSLGQQVVVENRPSILSAEIVAKATPDGYTLLLNGTGFWLGPLFQLNATYDALRDFAPISMVTRSPAIVAVHPSLPVRTVRELINLAKSKPGQINYGSSATGTPSHLAMELFKIKANVNILRIPYNSNGAQIRALISGEVQVSIINTAAVTPHIKSGALRGLAVTSAEASKLAPGLPTVADTIPGYATESTYGIVAPAGTPTPVIVRLNQDIVRFLNTRDAMERLLTDGVEVVGSSPESLASTIKSDLVLWAKVMKDAGIRPE